MMVTHEGVDEIASRAEYDERDEAHIAVTRRLPVGTSTVWIKVDRVRTRVLACASLMLTDVESAVLFIL